MGGHWCGTEKGWEVTGGERGKIKREEKRETWRLGGGDEERETPHTPHFIFTDKPSNVNNQTMIGYYWSERFINV